MTGVIEGSQGTGVLEGHRPGSGVTGARLSSYDLEVIALGPTVYFAANSIGPVVPPESYDTVTTELGPTVYFSEWSIY